VSLPHVLGDIFVAASFVKLLKQQYFGPEFT